MYTGNTITVVITGYTWPVYPCVYREHLLRLSSAQITHGLSLCIQGTQLVRIQNRIAERFIPVYTGNTLLKKNKFLVQAVYPCVYREHTGRNALILTSSGLSLCIQGTHLIFVLTLTPHRFIPVYTGNTKNRIWSLILISVYPCVYREHSKYI